MDYEIDTQWYSNRDLFEMLNGLKSDLVETRLEMKRYNDLRGALNEVMESQKKLAETVNTTWDEIEKIKVQKDSKRELASDTKSIILFLIAIGGWVITIIGFLYK